MTPRNQAANTRALLVALIVALLVGSAAVLHRSGLWLPSPGQAAPEPTASASLRQPTTWPSGAWTGGQLSTASMTEFGQWRGNPARVATTYPEVATWAKIENAGWHITTFEGFEGELSFGVPLLPTSAQGSTLRSVAKGERDATFIHLATLLRDNGRGDAYVRLGWEANGTWMPWGATSKTSADYVAAYRHVAQVMRSVAPQLRMVFDVTCGSPLEGNPDRLSALTALYPGDDVVDVVGCDFYDMYGTRATNGVQWTTAALKPPNGPGLPDVAEFARAHGKTMAVPEWGLASKRTGHGSGDNPFFIRSMHAFFAEHADLVEYEAYFNEPGTDQKSALWDSEQNPESAKVYRELWGYTGPPSASATPPGPTQ